MWMSRSSASLPAGYYYSLVGKKFWILGSGSDCTIILSDSHISSQHALLQATANREIYCSDLQSVNGSFVNGHPITQPTLLRHGDLLRVGAFEMEFQNSGELSAAALPDSRKSVLLLQGSPFQGKIWYEILSACGILVKYRNFADPNLKENIETIIARLEKFPNLLVADIEILKPNAYEFCRWCRDNYPDLKIILIGSHRTEIFMSEKRWAIHQGAVDLLPDFSEDSFFSIHLSDMIERVECILAALEMPPSHLLSLEPTLRSLMLRLKHWGDRLSEDPPATQF